MLRSGICFCGEEATANLTDQPPRHMLLISSAILLLLIISTFNNYPNPKVTANAPECARVRVHVCVCEVVYCGSVRVCVCVTELLLGPTAGCVQAAFY